KIVPGSLGTFAGAKTDPAARVVDRDGRPIAGLFAVGNDMASIMGGHYPSGGITLGPGMTFGYIAGRVLAGQPVTGIDMTKMEEMICAFTSLPHSTRLFSAPARRQPGSKPG